MLSYTVLSSLLLASTLASASHPRPLVPRALPSPAPAPTCEAGTTSFVCPSKWSISIQIEDPTAPQVYTDGRRYVICSDGGSNGDNTGDNTYCYFVPTQDYINLETRPDGTKTEALGNPACPNQATKVISCSPSGGSSYTCTNPATTYSCPTGYQASGTSPSGVDFICTSSSEICYYYTDSGRVDTLTPNYSSPSTCPTLAVQTGTCENSLRRRNGKSTSPSWLSSRQAVIKKGSLTVGSKSRLARVTKYQFACTR